MFRDPDGFAQSRIARGWDGFKQAITDPPEAAERLSETQYRFMARLAMVFGLLIGVLLLVGLSGCATTHQATLAPAVAPVASCDARCFEPCVTEVGKDPAGQPRYDTGVRWEGDPTQAATIDALGGSVLPALTEKLVQCEVGHRKVCETCLRNLADAGVIVLPFLPKPPTPTPVPKRKGWSLFRHGH